MSEYELPKEPHFYNYESPIEEIITQITKNIQQKEENCLMTTVEGTIGFRVDKDELIKALQYDRNQYEKGLQDGYIQAIKAMYEFVEMSLLTLKDDLSERSHGQYDAYTNIWGTLKKVLEEKEKTE